MAVMEDAPSEASSAPVKSDTSYKSKPSLGIAQMVVEIAGSIVCTCFVKLLLVFNFICAWVALYSRLFDVTVEHESAVHIVAFSSAVCLHVLSVTTAVLGVIAYGKVFASQWSVLPNVFFSAVEVIAFIVSFQHPAASRTAMLLVPITASARLVVDLLAPVTTQKFAKVCHQLSTKNVHLSRVQAAISTAAAHTHSTKCDALLDCAATVDGQKKQPTAWADADLYLFLNLALVTLTNSTHRMSWSAAQAVLLEIITHLDSNHSAPDGFDLVTAMAFGARYLLLTSRCRFAMFGFMSLLSGAMIVVESQCIAGLTSSGVRGHMHKVMRLAAAYCFLSVVHSGIRIAIYSLEAKLVPGALAHVQRLLASLIFSMDATYFSHFSVEFLATVFTANLAALEALWVAMLSKLILPAMQVLTALLFVMWASPEIGVLALTVLPPIMVVGPMGQSTVAVSAACSSNTATIARFKNGLNCCQLITVHAAQDEWIGQHFEPMVTDQARKHHRARLWAALSHCLRAELVRNFTALNVVILAIMLTLGKISVSSFTGYVTLFMKVRDPAMELSAFIHSALGSAGPAVRLEGLLLKTMAHHGGGGATEQAPPAAPAFPLVHLAGALEVSDLGFAYPQQMSRDASMAGGLRSVSFRIDPGELAVIQGPSGSGKTTLTSVLSTWLRPTRGRIRLGDAELQAAGRDSASTRKFRERVAFVPAEPVLFHASIADNIAFGFKGSGVGALPETVEWALHATGSSEFVARLENGHNTLLPGKDGSVLSDGQVQQLCIARALHRRPRLLLLEKALLALDADSKERVLGTLALRSSALSELGGLIIVSNSHEEQGVDYADVLLHMESGEVRVERLRTSLRTCSCPS